MNNPLKLAAGGALAVVALAIWQLARFIGEISWLIPRGSQWKP